MAKQNILVSTCHLKCLDMLDIYTYDLRKILIFFQAHLSLLVIGFISFTVVLVCWKIRLPQYLSDMTNFKFAQKKLEMPASEVKERLKEICTQKDLLIKSLQIRVQELEHKQNTSGEAMVALVKYEELIKKVMADNDKLRADKNVMQTHLDNLEGSFNGLLEKYEKARIVIQGLKDNERDFNKHVEKYEHILKEMEIKYKSEKAANKGSAKARKIEPAKSANSSRPASQRMNRKYSSPK